MREIIITIMLLGALTLPVLADESEQMRFADGLYARGMYELAVTEYERLLADYPKSEKVDVMLFRIAESLRHLDKTKDADKYFRDLYIKYPKSEFRHRAGFRRADLHRRTGELDNAITLYTLLLENGAEGDIRAASLYYIGEMHLELGRKDEALKAFEEVRDKHDDSEFYAYSMLKLGSVYAEDKGKEDKTIEAYRAVSTNNASSRMAAEALFQIADMYYVKKDYSRSADAYGKLLKAYPDDKRSDEAKIQAAWSLHNSGLYADALKLAEEGFQKKDEQAAEWLYLKANCLRQLLNNSRAAEAYEDLLKDFPDSKFVSPARYEKALSSYRAGKYQAAILDAERISIVPSNDQDAENLRKDLYWLLAESYAALKKDDDAVQYYRMIATDFPRSDVACEATYRLAYHLQSRKEFTQASRQYIAMAANFPEHELAPKALFASGICRLESGDHDGAVNDWSDLLKRYADDELVEEALYRKAVSEVRLARGDIAAQTLGELHKRFPESKYASEAHYWRGALFKDKNMLEDAEAEYREALKGDISGELQRDASYYLAVVLYERDNKDESAELFSSLIGTSASSLFTPELLEWLSGYWYLKGDFVRARETAEVMQAGFNVPSMQQTAFAMIARSYLAEGNHAKAEKAFLDALSIDVVTDYAAEAALRLGEIKFASGRNDEAMESFKKAADLAAGDESASVRAHSYAGMARVAKSTGDFEAASRYYMSVAILYDEKELVSECLYEAILAFRKLDRAEDEAKVMNELTQRYPDSQFIEKLKGAK